MCLTELDGDFGCRHSQYSQLLAELPAIGIDAGYGVVTEEELLKRSQPIQGAAVHLAQAVVLQVAV